MLNIIKKKFKLQKLKTVSEIPNSNISIGIKKSILLAKKLNIRIVAEGVENIAQWHLLKELGCDIAQGYFISRPLPESELTSQYQQWQSFYQTSLVQRKQENVVAINSQSV